MGIKIRVSLLVGLALAVAVAVPAVSQARTLYGTTGDGKLVTFADKQTKVKVKPKKGYKANKVGSPRRPPRQFRSPRLGPCSDSPPACGSSASMSVR